MSELREMLMPVAFLLLALPMAGSAHSEGNGRSEVKILEPNGGEVIVSGAAHNILWAANLTGTSTGSLFLSTDNRSTWVAIANITTGSGSASHSWVVCSCPATRSGYVKISLFDGTWIEDESDSPFSIDASTVSPKVIAVSPPNGTSDIPLETKLSISFDITMNTSATTAAISASPVIPWDSSWLLGEKMVRLLPRSPLSSATTYTVTVSSSARSSTGIHITFPVSYSFTTAGSPLADFSISIISPNGGGTLRSAETVTTSWDLSGPPREYEIRLEIVAGNNSFQLGSSFQNGSGTGSRQWQVPMMKACEARLHVQARHNTTLANDWADVPFLVIDPDGDDGCPGQKAQLTVRVVIAEGSVEGALVEVYLVQPENLLARKRSDSGGEVWFTLAVGREYRIELTYPGGGLDEYGPFLLTESRLLEVPNRPGGGQTAMPLLPIGVGLGLGALTIGVLIAVSTEAGFLALVLPFLLLYGRVKRDKALDHFARGQIYGVIRVMPGASYSDIRSKLGLANGTLTYHLHVLQRSCFVRVVREGRRVRFFPMEDPNPDHGILLSNLQRSIVEIVEREPGISQSEISVRLDASPQTVSYNVRRLVQNGLIRLQGWGMRKKCFRQEDSSAS